MGECFELSLFFQRHNLNVNELMKQVYSTLSICDGINHIVNHPYSFFENREIYCTSYTQGEYCVIIISIYNLTFTRNNLKRLLEQMGELIQLFETNQYFLFAAGIYELTMYYLGEIYQINLLKKQIQYFPIVFSFTKLQLNNEYTLYHINDLYCSFQKGKNIQQLF